MDFSFSSEQQQMRDALRRYLSNAYSFDKRRALLSPDKKAPDPLVWQKLAELGVLGLTVPPEYDGLGGDGIDLMIAMEEMGRHLVLEPFWSSAVLGTSFIGEASISLQKTLLPALVSGQQQVTSALYERQSRHDPNAVQSCAELRGNTYVINGRKTLVLHADTADHLVVSARIAGGNNEAKGISLFLIPRATKGLSWYSYRTVDGGWAADLQMEKVEVPVSSLLGESGAGATIIARVSEIGVVAQVAELIGCMESLYAMTLEYLKTRQQFGSPIGRFQALQHRATEMFMAVEQSRSLAYLAAGKMQDSSQDRLRTIHAAKAGVCREARFVAQEAVQMHGGMGMSDEMPIGHYFKRITMIEAVLGDRDYHLSALAKLSRE